MAFSDIHKEVEHIFLPFHWAEGIDVIESILLEEGEIHKFRLPESFMVTHRYTVVAKNVDLVGHFLSSSYYILGFQYLIHPSLFDFLIKLLYNLRVFEIF